MKNLSYIIAALLLPITAAFAAEPVTLAWDPYDEAIEETNGFVVLIGKTSQNYTMEFPVNDPAAQTAVLNSLSPGRYYTVIVARAADSTTGEEVRSDPSNEITFIVKPKPPQNQKKQ